MGSYTPGSSGVTNPLLIGELRLSSGGGNSNINSQTDTLIRMQVNSSTRFSVSATDAVFGAGVAMTLQGNLAHSGVGLGFYGSTPAAKATVTGSRAANAALASLLNALNVMGLITDSSSA